MAGLGTFSLHALLELGRVWAYTAEVLRQTKILIVGTTVILGALMFCVGLMVAVFGNYFLRSIGASDYVGLFSALAIARAAVPLMFGYAFSAKVGCGLAAEIGAMRVADEIDAFRSVGLDPMRFVVATRLAAALLYIPVAYFICMAAANAGAYIGVVWLVGEVSQGTFEGVHWLLLSVQDMLFALIEVVVIGVTIILVATYHGYRVAGGPVEVGAATAHSMVLNLVLVHVLNALFAVIFWGADLRLPIGG